MPERVIRKRCVLRGAVQGVGLRWRARQAAEAFGVCGWAQNAWDGSVTLELQGSPAAIDRVLQALCESRYIRLDSLDAAPLPPDPDARDFRILDDRW